MEGNKGADTASLETRGSDRNVVVGGILFTQDLNPFQRTKRTGTRRPKGKKETRPRAIKKCKACGSAACPGRSGRGSYVSMANV
jgi:hypothetical protein